MILKILILTSGLTDFYWKEVNTPPYKEALPIHDKSLIIMLIPVLIMQGRKSAQTGLLWPGFRHR